MDLAVVVGGTAGIGLAVAARFAAEGCRLVVTGRSQDRLRQALVTLPDADGIVVDAGDPRLAEELADRGPVHHLVLAASGGGVGPFTQAVGDGAQGDLEAKVLAHTLRSALPFLTERASVTFVTAASAQVALPGSAGLAAVSGPLGEAVGPLAAALAPRRVNVVSPGVIDVPWWHTQLGGEERRAYFARTAENLPLGRIGRPGDVAHLVVALALSHFTTGVVIPVDGGAHLASER
jgi:NAD(P)-dependent dehydrogenase (short-subunit alcohol dehydrogenase family)